MSNANVVVVGSSNMDIFCYTDHLPEPGETLIGDRYWMGLGGKGANQAVAARLLGADVTLVGRVGDDLFGQRMPKTASWSCLVRICVSLRLTWRLPPGCYAPPTCC
jgi:hypothetical protein